MKEFEEKSTKHFENELEKKRLICSNLEYEVLAVKKEISRTQDNLESIKEEIIKKTKECEERDKKNEKLSLEYQFILKDYLYLNTKLLQIYNSFKVDDITSVINIFKQEQIQYYGYNSLFVNLNKEISDINIIYSNYNDQLDKIKSQTKNKEVNMAEEVIEKMYIEYQSVLERNKYLVQANYDKEHYLKNVYEFLNKYDKKMSDMVNSIYIFHLNINHFSNKRKEELMFKNNDINIENLKRNKEWGMKEYREYLKYFLKFQRKACFIYTNFLMNMIVNLSLIKPVISNFIYGFRTEIVGQWVEKVILGAIKQYDEKLSYKNLAERNLFKDKTSISEKKKKDFIFMKKATLDDIVSHFHNHLRQSLEKGGEGLMEDLISTLKKKFFTHISKYTNDFVEPMLKPKMTMNPVNSISLPSQIQDLAMKKTVLNTVMKKAATQEINSNSEELNAVISKINEENKSDCTIKNSLTNINELNNGKMDDSYISLKEGKLESITRKKEINLFGYNKNKGEEVQKLYRRINDLHKLELDFFNSKRKNETNVDNYQFSEIYFNFKKKFNKKTFTNVSKNFVPFKNNKLEKNKFNNLSHSNVLLSSFNKEALSTTRLDTKSNYPIVNTEPKPKRQIINLTKTNPKQKQLYLKELFNDDYLVDSEREINNQLEKNTNNYARSISGIKISNFYSDNSSQKKDSLPRVNNLNGISYTKYYTKMNFNK